MRAMALGQRECLSKVLGARQVPASTSALGSGLRCLQALQSLRPALRAWATGREQELVKGVRVEKRSAAVTLALGFGRPEPEVLSALVPRLGSSAGEDTLAALTELGLEAPQAVLEAVRAAPAKDSPTDRINRLRLEARLEPSREAGWAGLAERVIHHPSAMEGVERPEGVLGPCPLERLGASPGTELPSVPECVLEVRGGSELTRPLTAWQAR